MMRERAPSVTAQRVAGYRMAFEREPAPFGDPSADDRLAHDVVGSLQFTPRERMARYLNARTALLDRVVINGLGRGVTQIACVGAGYDGRSLRYAKPTARWWEIDHPATQADKRMRLERLRIGVSHIEFVGLDLVEGGLDSALLRSGWDPEASSLMLCEGVAVYLDTVVFATLVTELRALACVGTRLALSVSLPTSTAADRARFEAAIADLGEPARNALSAEDATKSSRWRDGAMAPGGCL